MRQNSFNIVHLAVALLCVVVFVTITIVVSNANRRMGHPYTESMQLRGVHQGMVVYANSNKSFFPGLGPDGLEDKQTLDWGDNSIPPLQAGLDVDQRFAILLHGDFMTPEYLIGPRETDSNIKPWPEEGAITTGHYTYALLQIPLDGDRHAEWSQTLNSQAIVVSDRNTGTRANPSSIHVDPGWPWAGNVLWNDNHAEFGNASSEFETKYGSGELNEADRLFESSGNDDALMVHTGNGKD